MPSWMAALMTPCRLLVVRKHRNVRFWHKADIAYASWNVRFRG
jgi:hypothetical protein